uniref:Uncharacterized protein n=1 Tax=Cuerna arida TaxID=1464854 RepID=A0A1B6F2C4_9HEMI
MITKFKGNRLKNGVRIRGIKCHVLPQNRLDDRAYCNTSLLQNLAGPANIVSRPITRSHAYAHPSFPLTVDSSDATPHRIVAECNVFRKAHIMTPHLFPFAPHSPQAVPPKLLLGQT